MTAEPATGEAAGWTATGLLAEISGIGRDIERGGYTRPGFSTVEAQLRHWFIRCATELGLATYTDHNGNIWAWWGQPGTGAVITGSHLDSVPGGGAYDGPLGVASALAAVSRLRAAGKHPRKPLALAVFAEEEGSRFGVACLGSRLMTGATAPEQARALTDPGGRSLPQVFAEAELDADVIGADPAVLDRIGCFVELHVEQGRDLATRDEPIALATSIMAHGRWRIRCAGIGNHAGTTPMRDRHDPVVAAAAIIQQIRDLAAGRDAGDQHARATIGRFRTIPDGTNVIASAADMWVDIRADTDAAVSDLLDQVNRIAEQAAAAEGCTAEISQASYANQVLFDADLRDRLADILDQPPQIPTGAGHDAGILAAQVPTGMIFVRNPTGVSHAPQEAATEVDCEHGVAGLAAVLDQLADFGPA
jgi:N-carbamoyl-L-amino-acid hydrolase